MKYMTTSKIKIKGVNWKLLLILLIGILLRLWKLDIIPPHLTPDEAAIGYNAYSILKTGRDEYGQLLPVIFKSFGDFKPGLYIYLTVPFVAVLGLNEWSVRLPSALSGVLAIFLIHSIVGLVLDKGWVINGGKGFIKSKTRSLLPYLSGFLIAINPWHIYFSRGAWEVNVSLTLTLLGILFFVKFLRNGNGLILSSLFFSLTLLTYQGAKLSTAIVIVVLLIISLKDLKTLTTRNIKVLFIPFFLAIIITSPILLSFGRGQTGRLTVFSIFSYPRPTDYLNDFLEKVGEKKDDINYVFFHTENLNYVRGILGRYFNHFSGRFLFFEGDFQNYQHSSPNQGMLLLFDVILIPFGLIYIIRHRGHAKYFIFTWLILSPLPAVLTREQVQAIRSYNMLIPLTLISAFGLLQLLILVDYYKRIKALAYFSIAIFTVLFLGSILYYLDSYFIHLPVHNAKYWNYGYKKVIETILPIQDNYEKIYFQQSYDQPYMYYLFYSRYDPVKYQKQAKLSNFLGPDVGLVEHLDNITFAQWSWPYLTGEKHTMVIGNSIAIPPDFNTLDYNLISEIKYPDGFVTAFRIVETKQK